MHDVHHINILTAVREKQRERERETVDNFLHVSAPTPASGLVIAILTICRIIRVGCWSQPISAQNAYTNPFASCLAILRTPITRATELSDVARILLHFFVRARVLSSNTNNNNNNPTEQNETIKSDEKDGMK